MTTEPRHTADTITSDALDALYEQACGARALADEVTRLSAIVGTVREAIAPYDWPYAQVPVAKVRAALDEPKEPTT